MLQKVVRYVVLAAVVAGIGYGIYVALREQPLLVDLAEVRTGPMTVTVDEEGVARVRDVYEISSPISGHLDRTSLEEGDEVERGQTIALIHPLDPPFLDERTRAELVAIVQAARASVSLAEVERQRAETSLELAKSNYERALALSETNTVSKSQLERAFNDLQLQIAQVESAAANIELRKAELASAEAKLTQPGDINAAPAGDECCVPITSPIDGVILSVNARSEQAVNPGTMIAEVGDVSKLEIQVDLLSADATRIRPSAPVVITDWGGDADLAATVRRIEPAAFTKTSALGIEEQRVNVVLDLDDPPQTLGHGYRVYARLTVWETDDALQVPISALFRSGGDWSVFVADGDIARLQSVEIGQMNSDSAQVAAGLEEGDKVVLFPSDQLSDGRAIADRAEAG